MVPVLPQLQPVCLTQLWYVVFDDDVEVKRNGIGYSRGESFDVIKLLLSYIETYRQDDRLW